MSTPPLLPPRPQRTAKVACMCGSSQGGWEQVLDERKYVDNKPPQPPPRTSGLRHCTVFLVRKVAYFWLVSWLISWLVDLLVGRFVGWLIGWSIEWFVEWLTGWLIGLLSDSLVDGWLIGWFVGWLIGYLVGWLIDRLISWLVGLFVGSLEQVLTDRTYTNNPLKRWVRRHKQTGEKHKNETKTKHNKTKLNGVR